MHAAQVQTWGQPPVYTSISNEPEPPTGFLQLKILAVSAPNVVRSRASGRHYTTSPNPADRTAGLPFTPGFDGVGQVLTGSSAGKIAYFSALSVGKSYQEILNVPEQDVFMLPASLEAKATEVAGVMNPALSSWMAIRCRVLLPLPQEFTVLILGGTSFSARVAIPLLRHLGAAKIIGVARSASKMSDMGYDLTLPLHPETTSNTDFSPIWQFTGGAGPDLVLDYLFGEPAQALLNALPTPSRKNPKAKKMVQWVHIGSSAGREMKLGYDGLRNKHFVMTGSGVGAWGAEEVGEEVPELLQAIGSKGMGVGTEFRIEKLKDVETVWPEGDAKGRVIFTMD